MGSIKTGSRLDEAGGVLSPDAVSKADIKSNKY